jgi:hypothetical protein
MRDGKIVVAAAYPEGPGLAEQYITAIGGLEAYGKTYGVDYVNLGYVGGLSETTFAALASDVKRAAPSDLFGTPVGQLPMMADITDASDFKLIIVTACGGGAPYLYVLRQWTITYGVPGYHINTAGISSNLAPYFPDQASGVIDGAVGGAQYERLLADNYGIALSWGSASVDITGVTMVIMTVMIIIGNIRYQARGRRR